MPDIAVSALTIRLVRADERAEVERVVAESWGSAFVVSRGTEHFIPYLPCLVAEADGRWLGIAAFHVVDAACELVLLEAFERGRGIGTALMDAVAERAREEGAMRLWLVTTNDNTDALRFYQRRGMRLVRLWPDAVTQARRQIKPEIPLFGQHGIPIRDELELELTLVHEPRLA